MVAKPDRDAAARCEMTRSPRSKPLGVRLANRLALRPREAAAALGLSERAFRSLLPTLPHFRAGNAVLIPVDALRRWLNDRSIAQSGQAETERDRIDEITQDFLNSIAR